jgi:hypothetical protein
MRESVCARADPNVLDVIIPRDRRKRNTAAMHPFLIHIRHERPTKTLEGWH